MYEKTRIVHCLVKCLLHGHVVTLDIWPGHIWPVALALWLYGSMAMLQLFIICRHVFEDRMWAEEYRAEDVGRELGMEQAHLIRMAMLLGSDYTEGVSGIGMSV